MKKKNNLIPHQGEPIMRKNKPKSNPKPKTQGHNTRT
jgi:hypothetical protein